MGDSSFIEAINQLKSECAEYRDQLQKVSMIIRPRYTNIKKDPTKVVLFIVHWAIYIYIYISDI